MTRVTTHKVTHEKDDAILHIDDHNGLVEKLKGKCIQHRMWDYDCNKKKASPDAMFHRLYFIRFLRIGFRSMRCKGLLKVFQVKKENPPT